jgi:hypothetical protein
MMHQTISAITVASRIVAGIAIWRPGSRIGGYTDLRGSRSGFGALLLGYYRDGKLVYAGKTTTCCGVRSKDLHG